MRARSAASSGRAVRTLSARSSMGGRVRQSRTPRKSHFAAKPKNYGERDQQKLRGSFCPANAEQPFWAVRPKAVKLIFQIISLTEQRLFLNHCQELRALFAALAVMLRRGPVGDLREMRRDV